MANELYLWVANQVEGAGHDTTAAYLEGCDWRAPDGVTLNGQHLGGSDPEAVWAAFRELRAAVAELGHGGDESEAAAILEELGAPDLTACPVDLCEPGCTSAAEALARECSRTALTWGVYRRDAILT